MLDGPVHGGKIASRYICHGKRRSVCEGATDVKMVLHFAAAIVVNCLRLDHGHKVAERLHELLTTRAEPVPADTAVLDEVGRLVGTAVGGWLLGCLCGRCLLTALVINPRMPF